MVRQLLLLIFFSIFSLHISIAEKPGKKNKYLRVLTFNIYHGATMKGDFDLDYIADIIKSVDPDIVALQEVDFKTNRSKKYDIAAELGYRTKMAPLFGASMPYDGGEYGNAILSKRSIISSEKIALPGMKGTEPRSALTITTLTESGDTVVFISTHFSNEDERSRVLQAQKINELVKGSRYPAILAGDLNALPGSKSIETLKEEWRVTDASKEPSFTYPPNKPEKKIDYIMYTPAKKWKVKEHKTICDTIASDHCSYFVVLELKD